MMLESILQFLAFQPCFRCEIKLTSRTFQGMSLLELRDIWFRVWLSMQGLHASFYNLSPRADDYKLPRDTEREENQGYF
jgi:hypothetical protein